MKTCSKSPFTPLLKVIFITLLPAVLGAQEVKVTGYIGHDVTLPCQFIPRPEDKIQQVQWDLKAPDGKEIIIIVSSSTFGNVSKMFLKERVEIEEQSLIIRDVEMKDAGSYICSVTVFPRGSFKGTTNLHVQKLRQLSSGLVSAIVIVVIVLLVIMAAIVYMIFIRRRDPVQQRVYIDTSGPVMNVARPSVLVRDEDVVYSDVKLMRSRHSALSANEKHTADDVTYSEVLILRQQPKYDEMYAQVKRSTT